MPCPFKKNNHGNQQPSLRVYNPAKSIPVGAQHAAPEDIDEMIPLRNLLPQRKSIRLPGFNYAQDGVYFVTIDTYNQNEIFGDVVRANMKLNRLGLKADACWLALPDHFPGTSLFDHIVMPNHVHGLIVIQRGDNIGTGAACCAPTGGRLSKPSKGSLPVMVRSFKAAVTKAIHEAGLIDIPKVWQRGYYERVIRNERELQEAINYIRTNPAMWEARRQSVY